jgi:hypothetical protein
MAPKSEKPLIDLPESSALKLTVFLYALTTQEKFSEPVDEKAMATKTFG